MQKHKLNLYPEITGKNYERLKEKISSGYDKTFPIIVYENKILDGWNRYKVCKDLKIEPVIKQFSGTETEAIEFVIRSNERRDLTPSQRAVIAFEYLPILEAEAEKRMKAGKKIDPSQIFDQGKSTNIAAEKFGTNRQYVADVKKIKAETPEYFEKIKSGDLSIQDVKKEIKEAKKESRLTEMKKSNPKKPDGKYEIIYIDPPWQYEKDQAYFGQDVKNHYPTMTYEELENLNLKQYADKDCVLYMWATAPKLHVAIDLLRAWGFDYKTCLVWDKVKHNMGFYASIRHEILLIGGIGQSAPSDKCYANQTDSVYSEERTEHSRKPKYYYEMIEKMHPGKTKRIEFFSRNKQAGWESWGNEL